MTKGEAALAWAARGFRVFPLLPDRPGSPENSKRAKLPVWDGWTDFATTDPAKITAWWDGVDYNVGVLTTGLLVVDVDTKKGRPGMASWIEAHGAFDTLTVRTPSGGFHFYYSGAEVANGQGNLGVGLDVRGHHGYVVAPGSTIEGAAYAVEIEAAVQPAPQHLVARCKRPGERAENAGLSLVEDDGLQAVALAAQRIASTPGAVHGEQSEACFKLAAAVRDYGISEAMAAVLMDPWAARCAPPLGAEDLRGRIANAYLYAQNPAGAKNPEAQFAHVSIPALPVIVQPTQRSHLYPFGNATRMRDLQPRRWLLKRLLLRREVTALIAPGGVGKSLFSLFVAAHLALGQDCLDYSNALRQPCNSIIYNAEDSLDEMSMRLYAICDVLGFDPAAVIPRISLISGKTHHRLRLVQGGGPVPALNQDAVKPLVEAAMDPAVGLLALDPLNKLHTVNGIDNIAMTYVMEALELIAETADVALLLAHHTSKPSGFTKMAGNADTSQGASGVKDSARVLMTLGPPTDEDAARYGLTPAERVRLLRLDDGKMNRTLQGEGTVWLRKPTVTLWTGEEVGGLERADMHVRTEHMRQALARVLAAEMVHARGTAGVKLTDAARIVRSDPLFRQMPEALMKTRIQQYLTEPAHLEDGGVLRCVEVGGAVMVVLE